MDLQASPMVQLTPRQRQLLRLIADFRSERCYSPTIAELALELGVSRSTVFEHISELRKKGLLSDSPGKARSLRPTPASSELLDHCTGCDSNPDSLLPTGIPLLGRVAAGSPIEAIENKEQLSLACCFGNTDDIFALQVKGDSMIDAGIHSGDYVICRYSSSADNGQLVIAVVDSENATLKRFYREKAAVRLAPANDDYQPVYSNNCRIIAVVVGLIRKF